MTPPKFKNFNGSPGDTPAEKKEIVKYGISASPGIVIGTAFLQDSEMLIVPQTRLAQDQIDKELEKFQRAIDQTKEELGAI